MQVKLNKDTVYGSAGTTIDLPKGVAGELIAQELAVETAESKKAREAEKATGRGVRGR